MDLVFDGLFNERQYISKHASNHSFSLHDNFWLTFVLKFIYSKNC